MRGKKLSIRRVKRLTEPKSEAVASNPNLIFDNFENRVEGIFVKTLVSGSGRDSDTFVPSKLIMETVVLIFPFYPRQFVD